jgi:YbbR domain-containing protein
MRAVNLKVYRVYIDLNGLGPGTHEVELRYSNLVTDIDVTLTPAKVTLQIFKKVGDSLTLIPERIKIDKKDPKLVLTDIVLDTSEVTVRGADYQIEKIVSVKALIDVSQIQNTGEIILENNQIIAYDSKGMPVDVEIFPSTVSATITVDAPFKVVPITIKTIGELEAGFAVEDFVIEPQNVTLYAPQEDLDGITSFEIEVDLSQYTINDNLDNIVKQFTIEKPSKVNQMLEGQVSVTASFSSETELLIENVPINGINIPDGLSVYGKTEDDVVVDVLIKGSSTLLSEITLDDIVIEVDLTNLEAGEHQVDLIISGTDPKLEYELQKVKVTMILEEE